MALVVFSLSAQAIEYMPKTDVAFKTIQMHDATTWEKVCETSDGVCDVPQGVYQVKLLDENWTELVTLNDVRVRDSSSLKLDICVLYAAHPELPAPEYCPTTQYKIGDTGPAGGIVFHVTEGGRYGLEAAPVDQEKSDWCLNEYRNIHIPGLAIVPDTETKDVHSGAVNTPLIVAACGPSSAAGVAQAYVWPNGQTDGFLPNKEELGLLYIQRDVVGGISSSRYWSSTELNTRAAWGKIFAPPGYSFGDADDKYDASPNSVRAVRAF